MQAPSKTTAAAAIAADVARDLADRPPEVQLAAAAERGYEAGLAAGRDEARHAEARARRSVELATLEVARARCEVERRLERAARARRP